ncbi:SRPBCC family protein [Dyadobacter subterraneus]|uniref:SRPBCC family protein n=1 Tax=Dyadobacter subterraneus TaxID=2773304 RepID=A0ABR9W9X6_9BACT|nr:SRPBCC family protein [Dyadobacter subterraneus]MBE9462198.1 SRPBCC family protein [Dyadobacter subterraneus]
MATSTVKFHRVIKAPVSKVFRAFSSADAMTFWLPPYGFLCTVHEMDFSVGGSYRMSFHNFTTEKSHSFGGRYLEIIPGELLKYSDKFEDPNLPGEMTTTVQLKEVMCGTEINITQEGIPEQIPAEFCYLGWQESLEKLIKLVEPVIND